MNLYVGMVELVDTLVSQTSETAVTSHTSRAGSSPVPHTFSMTVP